MTWLFALLAVCIFAVELYANITNAHGTMAWIHRIVIGSLMLYLIVYLVLSARARFRHRMASKRGRRVQP